MSIAEPFQRKKLITANEELVALTERRGHNALLWFYCEEDLVYGSQNFIDLPDYRLSELLA